VYFRAAFSTGKFFYVVLQSVREMSDRRQKFAVFEALTNQHFSPNTNQPIYMMISLTQSVATSVNEC